MRITNKMMTNNMMSNINKNKLNMNTLEEQYSTGKKIQRPSDDPIVTVRALKLRTNVNELEQYYEKNIPDAKSWMDVTESSLTTVNELLSKINTYCVQGSTDTLTADDRNSIVENLEQMIAQIYQEGNTNYAGRYIFTGFKTDSSLIFTEDTDNLNYSITENIAGSQIQISKKIVDGYKAEDFGTTKTLEDPPQLSETYRIQLSYEDLSTTKPDSIRYYKRNSAGDLEEQLPAFDHIVSVSATDENAYQPDPGTANYIPETGEIILAADIYEELKDSENMEITYSKNRFSSGDLKPEHYFNCEVTDSDNPYKEAVVYEKSDQQIQYEINYNQKLSINTQGSDAISHRIGRCVEDILEAVDHVVQIEQDIEEIESRLEDSTISEDDVERYEKLKEQLETQLVLQKEAMQTAFEKGNTVSGEEQDRVNTAVADLGSRYVRLELTENRLSSQKTDFEDLMSKNEDADIVETIVKYTSAENLYNASLSAASKVVQNTLLDFL